MFSHQLDESTDIANNAPFFMSFPCLLFFNSHENDEDFMNSIYSAQHIAGFEIFKL
jgi:hypothetical protein